MDTKPWVQRAHQSCSIPMLGTRIAKDVPANTAVMIMGKSGQTCFQAVTNIRWLELCPEVKWQLVKSREWQVLPAIDQPTQNGEQLYFALAQTPWWPSKLQPILASLP